MITNATVLKKGIVALINGNFEYKVAANTPKEGFQKPSFFVYFLNSDSYQTTTNHFKDVYDVEIQFKEADNNALLFVADKLREIFRKEILVNGQHLLIEEDEWEIIENNLYYNFQLSVDIYVDEETNDKQMRTLEIIVEGE